VLGSRVFLSRVLLRLVSWDGGPLGVAEQLDIEAAAPNLWQCCVLLEGWLLHRPASAPPIAVATSSFWCGGDCLILSGGAFLSLSFGVLGSWACLCGVVWAWPHVVIYDFCLIFH
jgi:hypothetical protein